jgi:hypothetical protein
MVHSSVLLVLCAFYPVWLLAGWLDYRDHRRKETAPPHGAREAALHLAMLVQVGIGLAATLAYLPSYVLLLVLLVLAMAYLVTTSLTPRWVDGRRRTGVLARLQNTLFEALPLLALALFIADTLPRLDRLATPAWTLVWRSPPLPPAVWLAVFLPAAIFAVGPGLAELRRALRARDTQAA